jgi:two-component system phosphate regulon sensor histidine kinase PhoR
MTAIFKKSYKFSLKSSLYITLFATVCIFGYHYFFTLSNLVYPVLFLFVLFGFSFFVIQYRVEKFIYRRVKKIYDDVSLLENTSFRNQPITTDMATLTREVKKFARDKKLEIETLKIKEEYPLKFYSDLLKSDLFQCFA